MFIFLACLDLAAIPDFAAGAMENWGLITYRLTKILIDEETSSALDKQSVAMVISHEIAHQVSQDTRPHERRPHERARLYTSRHVDTPST